MTAGEVAFRWWCSLAREKSHLDGFGFPADTTSPEEASFHQAWLDIPSSETDDSTPKNSPWFFDVNGAEEEQSHPSDENSVTKKTVWNEKDDEMLDRLLEDGDKIPDLQWSYSFEEPSWKFETEEEEFPTAAECNKEEKFCNQEFRWDEAKFFDLEEAFTAASTETGSDLTGSLSEYYDDDISTLTASGIYSIESSASEESNWYRTKIASLFASKKRPVVKMRKEDLEVWPKNQVPSPPTAETPLLVQVSQEELTRRISIMQERQIKKVEIENLAKSEDPKLRETAQKQLKEMWITAYTKKPRNSGLSSGRKENLIDI